MELASLLDIRPGVTAVIGGGGKTTLLRTLGGELAADGKHVLVCTTTKILPFPDLPCARTSAELEMLREKHRLVCAGNDVPLIFRNGYPVMDFVADNGLTALHHGSGIHLIAQNLMDR